MTHAIGSRNGKKTGKTMKGSRRKEGGKPKALYPDNAVTGKDGRGTGYAETVPRACFMNKDKQQYNKKNRKDE
jgi:hypothetical protein